MSIFSNKLATIGMGVAFLGGIFVLATVLGPDNPSAKQCFETAYEQDEEARIDPSLQKYDYLGNNFDACREGCDDEGDASSCSTVAVIYSEGKGLFYEDGVNLAKAEEYATKACTLRGDTSCASAHRFRCLGDRTACEDRCRTNGGPDCVTLARGIDGFGKESFDPARAVELHGHACRSGIEESCAKERRLLCASRPVDCADRCKAGEAALCYELGILLTSGIGEVVQNSAKGLEFKRKGCELDPKVSDECPKLANDAKLEL